ncbi:MAG: ABC transporter permease [Treponemataceae bacterium]
MREAFRLLLSGDGETWGIVARSVRFSFLSTVFALLPGVPLGIALALGRFPGKRIIVSVVNAMTAVPTVVIGLVVYTAISRSGPMGNLGWLFAPTGVVLGQTCLALPVVTALSYTGLAKLDPRFHETLTTLGAKGPLRLLATIREARPVLIAAAVTAFGRVTGEVGVSMMLGGNIRHLTRTMTTAIALDAAKGDFERALSLGVVLLLIALAVNLILHLLTDPGV